LRTGGREKILFAILDVVGVNAADGVEELGILLRSVLELLRGWERHTLWPEDMAPDVFLDEVNVVCSIAEENRK